MTASIAATAAVATVAVLGLGTSSFATTSAPPASTVRTNDAVIAKRAFHDGMRRLWQDHVAWTRLFIVSFAADVPDLQAITNRLCRTRWISATRSSRSTARRQVNGPPLC